MSEELTELQQKMASLKKVSVAAIHWVVCYIRQSCIVPNPLMQSRTHHEASSMLVQELYGRFGNSINLEED